MDIGVELNIDIEKLLQRHEDICTEFEKDIERTSEKLRKFLLGPLPDFQGGNNIDKTPKPKSKRKKHLSIIVDTDTEDNTSIFSNNDSNITAGGPKRPQRAAKSNLDFKEPAINRKCRRPSNMATKNIKEEQNLSITNKNLIKKSIKNDQKFNREESLIGNVHAELMEIDEDPNTEANKNNSNASVVIVQKKFNEEIVEIQDSENEVMPPPPAVSLKKNLRNKKQSEFDSINSTNSKLEGNLGISNETNKTADHIENTLKEPIIKLEKLSLEATTKSKKEKPTGKKAKKPVPRPIKEERISSDNIEVNSNVKRFTRSTCNTEAEIATATKVIPSNTKTDSLESVYEDAIPPNGNLQSMANRRNSAEQLFTSPNAKSNHKSSNGRTPEIGIVNDSDKSQIDDATFVSAKDSAHNIAVTMANETFVAQTILISAQSTFIMTGNQNIMNETQCLNGEVDNGDMTFDVPASSCTSNGNMNKKKPGTLDSIMTEDDSDDDIPLVKYKPKLKSHLNKKELFNPFVQSPVKKKVEAFEKKALNSNTPIPQRQTRTKTRAKKAKENSENIETVKPKPVKEKNITPLIGRQIGRLLTPGQQSNITPTIGGIVKKMPNSTSKIIGIQKTLQSAVSKTSLVSTSSSSLSTATGRTPLQSRENSVEDLKRYAEERKKKNELKQQQAQQARERKEKERNEHLKKMLEEREEKAKRKAAEAEQKRQIDEIQRQLKLQEEKIEQQKKLEKLKAAEKARKERDVAERARVELEAAEIARIEREAAEIARKEREMLENIKIQKAKEKMQLKFEQNKKQLQQKKLISSGTPLISGPKYDFDMLNSDDSTDDESTVKANRPPIPHWSKSSVRHTLLIGQTNVPAKVIDSFFSVQPLTPDLTEIFPSIDAKYLKRNSSVIWNTPPRYSQLSKKY